MPQQIPGATGECHVAPKRKYENLAANISLTLLADGFGEPEGPGAIKNVDVKVPSKKKRRAKNERRVTSIHRQRSARLLPKIPSLQRAWDFSFALFLVKESRRPYYKTRAIMFIPLGDKSFQFSLEPAGAAISHLDEFVNRWIICPRGFHTPYKRGRDAVVSEAN